MGMFTHGLECCCTTQTTFHQVCCTRPTKKTRLEHLCLVQQTVLAYDALNEALSDVVTKYPKNQESLLLKQKQSSSSNKNNDCLHTVCELFPTNKDNVQDALKSDPNGISSPNYTLTSSGAYSLPINIALKNKATMDVLELLVREDPSVLVFKDGFDQSPSLNIALRNKACNVATVDLFLAANPNCIRVVDCHLNYPLHVACASEASLEVVKHLYNVYPKACLQWNIHNETPLQISERRNNRSSLRDVVEFLRTVSEMST